MLAAVRLTVARWLEAGSLSTPLTRALARVHATIARRAVARPLRLPDPAPGRRPIVTVTVGGATLGGSGKTRVALACVRELAARGARVVLVGHAYRASLSGARARVVAEHDALDEVGDEALLCARAVASVPGACVVVGPTRQAALDLAASLEPAVDVVVFDGPLQLAPGRASLAVLALDAHVPWGAAVLPPAGDLRAPLEVLLAASDRVVEVDALPRSALVDGRVVELATLASRRDLRLGLFTAIARPDRLERALRRAGLVLAVVVRAADHGPLTPTLGAALAGAGADLWLTTPKCALHLEAANLDLRLGIVDDGLDLPPALVVALRSAWELAPYRVP